MGGFAAKPGADSRSGALSQPDAGLGGPGKRSLTELVPPAAGPATRGGASGASSTVRGTQRLTPETAAEMLRQQPGQEGEIFSWLNRELGPAFVNQVVAILELVAPGGAPGSDTAATAAKQSEANTSTPAATTANTSLSSLAEPEATQEAQSPEPARVAGDAVASRWQLPAMVRVTATDGLRVRSSPDVLSRANVVGGLEPQDEIEALAQEGEWLRVIYRGAPAYIHGSFVEHMPEGHDGPAPAHGAIPSSDTRTAAPDEAEQDHTSTTAPPGTTTSTPSNAEVANHASTDAAPPPRTAKEPGAGEFRTLSGNVIAKTTAKEAAVLNAVRADPRRFDPEWLQVAQQNLGVGDATGAFNTETLRAMRARAGNSALGASGILNESFLASLAQGSPFFGDVTTGFEQHDADPGATRPADRAAQAVGYASYVEYRRSWVSVSFLGKPLTGNNSSGQAHPYLAARLTVAEAFLRQRHPTAKDDAAVRRAIGWNGQGNAAYDDEDVPKSSHQHTMGLALDIDPAHNPYFFNESVGGITHEQSMWWIATFEEMFAIAAKLYGGEPIDPRGLLRWSQTSSTEELIQRVTAISSSFAKYLDLSKRSREEILSKLVQSGYTAPEAESLLPTVQKAEKLFHNAASRKNAKEITNIRDELVIALRDVAGLSWGGTEMSARENGDFMHFDCRDTEFGRAVYLKKSAKKK